MTVVLWDARSGARISTLCGHNSGINAVAFSPDSGLLASSSFSSKVWLWDATTGESLGEFKEFVLQNACSPPRVSGVQVCAAAATVLQGHPTAVVIAASSPDGEMVATGSDDGVIKLWTKGGEQRWLHKRHSRSITLLDYSPDSNLLASSSVGHSVVVCGTATGHVKYAILMPSSSTNGPRVTACFSADGRSLDSWVLGNYQPVIIREPLEGEIKHRLKGHWIPSTM